MKLPEDKDEDLFEWAWLQDETYAELFGNKNKAGRNHPLQRQTGKVLAPTDEHQYRCQQLSSQIKERG
jgi:hypothetical protein